MTQLDASTPLTSTDDEPSGRRMFPTWRWVNVRGRLIVLAIQLAIVAAFVTAWQLLSGDPNKGALIDEFFVGVPSKILDSFTQYWSSGLLRTDVVVSLQETIIGFLIGGFGGVTFGLILGVSRRLNLVLSPFVYALYSIPRLALVPMLVLWFGIGMGSKIALVILLVFFLTFYSTFAGAQEVDQELVKVLRIMDATPFQVHRSVTVPAALSWVASGLRVSVPYAFAGAIVGEIFAGNKGLGYRITFASNQFDPNLMWATILVATALALALNGIVQGIVRRFMRWKVSDSQNTW